MAFEHLEEKEAVKRAAMIEENGVRFYTLLSEKTQDEEARAVFKKLARDEKKHFKVVEEKFFPEAGYSEQITEEELALEEYIEKTGAADIFTKRIDVDALVGLLDHPRKALMVALHTERYAVELFSNLAERSETDEGKKIYEELAEEERSHVSQIEALLAVAPPF